MDKIRSWVLANDPDSYTKHRQVLATGVVALIRPNPARTAPCLIIACENDSGSTPQMAQAIAGEINGSEILIVPDPQHLGLVEQTALFSTAIYDFLTRVLHTTGQLKANKNDNNDRRASSRRGAKNRNLGHVFGLIGSATMEIFDAPEINFIGIHDERTGTYMADGYARAIGGPAWCWRAKTDRGPPTLSLVWRRRWRRFRPLSQSPATYPPRIYTATLFKRSINKRFSNQSLKNMDRPLCRAGAGNVPRGVWRRQCPAQGPCTVGPAPRHLVDKG